MITLISTNTIPSPQGIPELPASQQQQNTTLTPLDVCPAEYCQTVKTPPPTSCMNIVENQNILENERKSPVTTHQIGGWTIHESSQPFQRKENKPSSSIEQVTTNKSTTPCQSDVRQWSIDEVGSYVERVLGKNCYTSIIKEHLIDGAALLLLKDEHLRNVFKMPLESRLKLLNRIKILKNIDFSE